MERPFSRPASNLWAHLLPKDSAVPPPDTSVPIPPMAPIDRTATSVRILLHDTQANIEKFSAKVDEMTKGTADAKKEIVEVKKMFQQEREATSEETYTLLNRVQTQIQKSVGSPVQTSAMEQFSKEFTLKIEQVDKQLQGIQELHQNFSQVLHNQTHVLQALQEQQNTILASVLPLLPLVQALPLHVDNAKTAIFDRLVSVSAKPSAQPALTRLRTSTTWSSSRRQVEPLSSSSSPTRPEAGTSTGSNKKRRLDDESTEQSTKLARNVSRNTSGTVLRSLSRAERIQRRCSAVSRQNGHHPLLIPPSASKGSGQDGFRTPVRRQPLAGLPLPAPTVPVRTPAAPAFVAAPARVPVASSPTPASVPALRSPIPLREASTPAVPTNGDTRQPSGPATTNPILRGPESFPNRVVSSSPAPSYARPCDPVMLSASSQRASTLNVKFPGFVPARQRRSPFREGRRFIPLDDTDSDDSNLEG